MSREAPPLVAPLDQVASFGGLCTRSSKMLSALCALERLATSDVSLLLEGETGVGKELAAESVHRASPRSMGPFIVFDCAAKSLKAGEFELFGAESRIDAQGMPGTLELACTGTVLLDHIDELALPLQAKLLRALERGQLRRMGNRHDTELDVRLIAACTGSLRRAVRLGAFNRQLYARLSSECVRIPPLRERREDLSLLAQEFLAACKPARALSDIPERVWQAFSAHHWPGNVRELKNALQSALIVPDRELTLLRKGLTRGLKLTT